MTMHHRLAYGFYTINVNKAIFKFKNFRNEILIKIVFNDIVLRSKYHPDPFLAIARR